MRLPLAAVNPMTKSSRPPGSTPSASLSSVQLEDVALDEYDRPPDETDGDGNLVARQTPSSVSAVESGGPPTRATSVTSRSTLRESAVVTSSASGSSPSPSLDPMTGRPIYHIDGYDCTADLTLQFMGHVLEQYFRNTSNTLEADVSFITMNVHAARDADDSNDDDDDDDNGFGQLTGENLPFANESLTSALHEDLRPFLYSPPMLAQERRNLNNSWLALPATYQPNEAYMTFQEASPGVLMTPDGWPSEYVLVFTRAMRLLAGLGTVDPQMANYDLSFDQDTIFPPNYIRATRSTAFNTSGAISESCFYNAGATSVAATNSSWAVTRDIPTAEFDSHPNASLPIIASISNLTACGISPLLNTTLADSSAASQPLPYRRLSLSTSWSWVPGILDNNNNSTNLTTDGQAEPTLPTPSDTNTPLRCAVLSLAHNGRWLPVDCGGSYRAACRVDDAPNRWAITPTRHEFDSAFDACQELDLAGGAKAAFDVPRTGLDNAYLHAVAQGMPVKSTTGGGKEGQPGDDFVWLAFNSADRADCWVVGGTSEGCPYVEQQEQVSPTVVIPVVASVIILIVTALTVFVKCAANRRSQRRVGRRKKEDGWGDYEGVPS